ncbi:hypothetical protein MUY27_15420 [Mucilaginibacter sp. RS28]|uniref:PylC N-terminal domain-containing protein n=1 Tax=Mucilaginibacter straminoryzae TaxID=2932774 RepID=A0A9X1X7H6_9SPHI|nr:hypothetical protein [Mucilaginibacter straminoryzae]MCJ8211108.1 hypothetical protein [Mucilaginibacter straminoryzae]
MSILITGALSAKAHQLKQQFTDSEVLLGDFEELPIFMVQSGKMLKLPAPKSAAYLHEMLAICLDNGVTRVLALNVQEFQLLSEAVQLFDEYGIQIERGYDGL